MESLGRFASNFKLKNLDMRYAGSGNTWDQHLSPSVALLLSKASKMSDTFAIVMYFEIL